MGDASHVLDGGCGGGGWRVAGGTQRGHGCSALDPRRRETQPACVISSSTYVFVGQDSGGLELEAGFGACAASEVPGEATASV